MCTEAEAKNSGANKEEIKQVMQLTDRLYLQLKNLLSISQEICHRSEKSVWISSSTCPKTDYLAGTVAYIKTI